MNGGSANWPLQPFNDAINPQGLRREWEEWLRSFELLVELKGVQTQHEKLVMLLTYGGRGLQRTYYNAGPAPEEIHPEPTRIPYRPEEEPEYDNAIKRLNKFFVGKHNDRVELEIFRSMRQTNEEAFNLFLLRLREQAVRCDFGERIEKEIMQQVTMGARDERVRDKGMENVMTLDEITNYAVNREILYKQKEKAKFVADESLVATVQRGNFRRAPYRTNRWKQPQSNHRTRFLNTQSRPMVRRNECYNCGAEDHYWQSPSCPGRRIKCNRCNVTGHYGRKCPGRQQNWPTRNVWKRPEGETNNLGEAPWKEELPRRPTASDVSEGHSYHLLRESDGIITCKIDTFPVQFLIDSGSSINSVTSEIWDKIGKTDVKIYKTKFQCSRQFKSYASEQPLQISAIFEAWISVNETKPKAYAEFFVVTGANKCLLSKQTAEELRVLKVGLDVQHVQTFKPFPKFPNIEVKLTIDEKIPPKRISYLRVPSAMEQKVDEKILEMLRCDIIEPVQGSSDWISPMVVVPKGKDDVRLCINMRYPNTAIQREYYPLPVIDTFLNRLRGSVCFSKLDITSAFHHIELHPDSRGITTFMTGRGLMRFKRLFFGINCAPEIFQRVMTQIVNGIDGVIVYIDDIVVTGRTRQEHDTRLRQVLKVIRQNNALLNEKKCSFGVDEIDILGFKVNAKGISPSDEKISAIKNFRKPETKEETRSFLGLVNFVGHFIPKLSSRSEPLRKFIRGEVEVFGKEQCDAFDDLRNDLTVKVLKLGFFDPLDATELYVDASPSGLGAVLVQRDKENFPRIICFASKGLTTSEKVYPQTQREALAVVWAVEKFYLYVFGMHFILYTDHKTLEYIYGGKHQDGRRACTRAESWALRLQPYTFTVKHIPGHMNISDILSRLCPNQEAAFDEASEHFLFAVGEGLTAINLDEIRNETRKDGTLTDVIEAMKTGNWPANLIRYEAFKKELGIMEGIVIRDERIILPQSLRNKALDIAHRGHPGVIAMRKILREKVWWPYMDRDVTNKVQECAGCAAVSSQFPPEPMTRKEIPERPWQDIAIDFFSVKECGTFLIIVDYFSRFLRVIEMKLTSASHTTSALQTLFDEHFYPETIRCDNGPPFASQEFASYCANKNIRLVHSIPYWPQMNGLVERQNQGLLRALRIAKTTNKDWRASLKEYVQMYNSTPHTVTGKAPIELMTGRPIKDLLPSIRTDPYLYREEAVRERDAVEKLKGKKYADSRRHATPSDIKVNDTVIVRSFDNGKLEPKFKLERFRVDRRAGSDCRITNDEGVSYRRSVTHLRKLPRENEGILTSSQGSPGKDESRAETTETGKDPSKGTMEAEQFRRMSSSEGVAPMATASASFGDMHRNLRNTSPIEKRPVRLRKPKVRYSP
ncbi:uncharacterized protein K02A2.6-like [Uranotaenia lowii]|uniref:uncharacterized protein K02A2.6-like n=1 Tax=Uranotaenia lowii TaxID=190385 RepID=UPI0024797519|nr:uncharacterized protein K02A2.6-like [Uranotaenia lowii]